MSYVSDTMRCPYCRGDMLVTKHMSSEAEERVCGACGTMESWTYVDGKLVHKLQRPRAYVFLVFPYGCQEFAYYGNHPYKWANDWKKNVRHMPDVILAESSGVVYNKKHRKLTTVFGHKPTIYPDSYYEEDEMF